MSHASLLEESTVESVVAPRIKRHRVRRIFLMLTFVLVIGGTGIGIYVILPKGTPAISPSYPAAPIGPRPTVLLLHGYGFFQTCPSDDGAQKWAALYQVLQENGWQAIQRVGYYACDINQDVYMDNYGRFPMGDARNHEEYYNTSPCQCTSHQQAADQRLSHTKDTDIRHLAYHLAWYIWDTYAQFGKPVVIVAHSMAGLIVRWMLYAIQNPLTVGQGLFPSRVFIPQIVTLSAPNAGISFIGDGLQTYQAEEMKNSDAFMQALDANALDPQAAGGTDWTLIGNYPADRDLVVTAASSTAMDHVHRVLYFDESTYTHNAILNDTSTARDARVYRCDTCLYTARIVNGDFTRYTDMPHSLEYINAALISNTW